MTLEKKVKERLVKLVCGMPNLQEIRDRQHFVDSHLAREMSNHINLNGSKNNFSSELVTHLASKGAEELISFLEKLAACESVSFEHKGTCQELVKAIKCLSLSNEEWNIEFPSITDSQVPSITDLQAVTRRQLLYGLVVGIGSGITVDLAGNFLPSDTRKGTLLRLNHLIDPKPAEDFIADDLTLLFGSEPSRCGILPGTFNKHLVAQGKRYTTSEYVKLAYKNSSAAMKGILGIEYTEPVLPTDDRMGAECQQNLLILGGPVASQQTRELCGYREIPTETNPNKLLPVKAESSLLPYHFYCGNQNGWGYWGEEERKAKRWLEDGTEKMLPLYGIIDSTKSTLLEPPLDGDRLAGDMLMITRLPNPDNVNGTCTIVSGMHGYSLEVFFKNLSHNLSMFREVLEADEHDCFQAIIPISIDRNRELTIKWSYKGNWSHTLTEIDRDAYLASVKPNV